MKLVAQVNGDDDILDAWFRHYLGLGVTSFHLIVHGGREQNRRVYEIRGDYPVHIEDEYVGEFLATEKLQRITALLDQLREQWIIWVDSDEFVELPWPDLQTTVKRMERLHSDVLAAPLLQRLTADGSLSTPSLVKDPFRTFPLGSVDLYSKMGVDADIMKYPVFYCARSTVLNDGGNHGLPYGSRGRPVPFRGVSHHFKWRQNVRDRIVVRAESSHPFRHQSQGFAAYLGDHDWTLPLTDSFTASTDELRRRHLLGATSPSAIALRWTMSRLPSSVDDRVMGFRRRLKRS